MCWSSCSIKRATAAPHKVSAGVHALHTALCVALCVALYAAPYAAPYSGGRGGVLEVVFRVLEAEKYVRHVV